MAVIQNAYVTLLKIPLRRTGSSWQLQDTERILNRMVWESVTGFIWLRIRGFMSMITNLRV
jgi:hypothetical protein